MSAFQFDDIFAVYRVVKPLGPDSKVSRIRADGEWSTMELQLDVVTADYPIKVGDRIHIALDSTLNLPDDLPDTLNHSDGADIDDLDMDDDVEYVARGKLRSFKEDPSDPENIEVELRASFGGLLMILEGGYPLYDPDDHFEQDMKFSYLCARSLMIVKGGYPLYDPDDHFEQEDKKIFLFMRKESNLRTIET